MHNIENETDIEEIELKIKAIEEIPHRRPMSEEQHVDKLLQLTFLFGVGSRDTTAKSKTILKGIVKYFNNIGVSRTEKKQAKIFWPGVSCNKKLGRGKKTLAKKTK